MVKIDARERVEPGKTGGGQRKYYAIVKKQRHIDLRQLAEEISKMSTVSSIDTIAVLEGLVQVIPEHFEKGNLVELGDLGSFRLSISSTASVSKEEVSTTNITDRRILFKPGKRIKSALKLLKFRK